MNGFPLGLFPTQVGLHGGWWSIGPKKYIQQSWLLLSKNPKDINPSPTQKQKWTFPDSSLLNHYKGGARGVMVIVIRNGHSDTSSNPGQD